MITKIPMRSVARREEKRNELALLRCKMKKSPYSKPDINPTITGINRELIRTLLLIIVS